MFFKQGAISHPLVLEQDDYMGKFKAIGKSKIYFNKVYAHVMDDLPKGPMCPSLMDMPGWKQTMDFFSQANFKA